MKCSIEGCDRVAGARGWCKVHYCRWWRYGDPLIVKPPRWEGYVKPTCSVEGCDRIVHAKGLCTIHRPRMRRHGNPLAGRRPNATGGWELRFWSQVLIGEITDCWPWQGNRLVGGYGVFPFDNEAPYAHRTAYEMIFGPIPEGLALDHVCHSYDLTCSGGVCPHRLCVNPSHLEAVTNEENLRRGRERARLIKALKFNLLAMDV